MSKVLRRKQDALAETLPKLLKDYDLTELEVLLLYNAQSLILERLLVRK